MNEPGVNASAFGDDATVHRIAKRTPKRHQQAQDLAYWLSRPMAERLAAVEALREQASLAEDFRTHKRASGRLKDLADLEWLEPPAGSDAGNANS